MNVGAVKVESAAVVDRTDGPLDVPVANPESIPVVPKSDSSTPDEVAPAVLLPVQQNTAIGPLTTLLTRLGIVPAPPGVPSTPLTRLLEMIWVAVRRIEYVVFNQSPRLTTLIVNGQPDGSITGLIRAMDPDPEDRLTFTVVETPRHGSLDIDSEGYFIYTPDPDFAATGGIDSFTVAYSDAGRFHLHLGGRHTITVPVTLEVAPQGGPFAVIDFGDDTPVTHVRATNDPRFIVAVGVDKVQIVDTSTGTIVGDPFKIGPVNDIEVSRDGSYIYVATDLGITRIDVASGQITELFDQRVTFIELNSAGSELYSYSDQYGQYWVLDPVSGEVIRNYPAVSGPTHAVSISPDEEYFYLLRAGFAVEMARIDHGEPILGIIVPGAIPGALAAGPSGHVAYALSGEEQALYRLDFDNRTRDSLQLGVAPRRVVATDNYVFVGHDTQLSVVDVRSWTVISTLPLAAGTRDMALSADGSYLYVAGHQVVQVFSVADLVARVETEVAV
ncbi:Ig-like domain-containing protein [Mycolicibacterium hassiacum]|uniref:Ig-like domain-containing protein n=1 Tax=Mycolicibacterium hassiacum TaxID=46351 RepID=UPI0023F7C86B|nr:Ig-like domain-containing protein [Mycolicibacterium hassiacum]